MIVVACLCAALTAACLVSSPTARAHRLSGSRAPRRRRLPWPLVAPAIGAAVLVVGLHQAAGRPHLVVLAATAAGVVAAAGSLLRRQRRRRAAARRRVGVVAACDALVAELQSGSAPPAALAAVVVEMPELAAARDAAALGADVPAVLLELARRPGGEPLRALAAAWQVASRSGAGLADVLDRISRTLRDDAEVRRQVEAALATPRSTARMMAVLPLMGVGLGTVIGAAPLEVLLTSMLGAVCLALACGLAVAGVTWVERLADAAEV